MWQLRQLAGVMVRVRQLSNNPNLLFCSTIVDTEAKYNINDIHIT